MKSYYVYIVQCIDGSFYTGVTNNLERRIIEHNFDENPKSYTYRRRPVKLKWFAEFSDINLAIEKEKQIKGWTRAKKMALIKKDYKRLVVLSKPTKRK